MNPFKRHEKPDKNLAKGSSGAAADTAVEGKPDIERSFDPASTAPARPLGENEKPDQLADKESQTRNRQEALLDEAVEETFPSSDPISPKHIT